MKTVAVIGNPNVGKTAIFNLLTGMKQRVANWPGVTVERKEGFLIGSNKKIKIVDLPGTYSLTSGAVDERIAKDFIVNGNADVIVDILDASNLARNLNLTLQLIEMELPLILVLNKSDTAQQKGAEIDCKKLSRLLGVPVIETVAVKNKGIDKLKSAIAEAVDEPRRPATIRYPEIEDAVKRIQQESPARIPRWKAIHILENSSLSEETGQTAIEKLLVPNARFSKIKAIVAEVFRQDKQKNSNFSDKLDRLVLNKFLALPIFLILMWFTFNFAFKFSVPFMDWISMGFTTLGKWASLHIKSPWMNSLLVDGVISGLGFIFTFVPPIAFLFFAISWLEDSGYLPRAAFFMDKFMSKAGLHGQSFIPMLMGLGCNVPAIMATRNIDSEKDRLITILVNPLISCSARLPVYVLLAGAFFPESAGTVILSIYLLGVLLAVFMALIFRKFLVGGEPLPFILELPDYQWPGLKATLLKTWQNVAEFLKKASTFLLAGILVVWFLNSHPWGAGLENSYSAEIGRALELVFRPLGFNWKINVALLSGFTAKEMVVGSLGTLYGVGKEGLAEAMTQSMNAITAYTFMVFVLIYTPCLAVLGAIKKETGSWKWTAFSVAYSLLLAYTVAFMVKIIGGFLI